MHNFVTKLTIGAITLLASPAIARLEDRCFPHSDVHGGIDDFVMTGYDSDFVELENMYDPNMMQLDSITGYLT